MGNGRMMVNHASLNNISPYISGVMILLLSAPLSFVQGIPFAVGMLILAALSVLHTRHLLRKAEIRDARRAMLDEQLCRAREFSSVDELSAGIAHEINNPLGIIAQETQWMQHLLRSEAVKDLKERDDLADSIKEISVQVNRCKEIVHKLLSLAREMEPVIQCADINEIVMNLADLVARQAGPRNITITRDLQTDLPMIYSDPPLIRQVVLNLLINSVHAINEEGRIIVTTRSREKHVEIAVADSGCGIPRENLSRIFTPFFSTKPQGKGTGLGLAICRGIIERLGGHISVESEAGKWTVFKIHLPLDGSRAKE